MSETVSDFVTWLTGLPPVGVYLVIFALAYLENLIPLLPGDLVVVVGGYLAAQGTLSLPVVLVGGTVASVAGFLTTFWAGSQLGPAIRDPHRLRWIPKASIGQAEAWLRRYGYGLLFVNRFLSGTRAVVGLLAGAAHLPAWPVVLWVTAGTALWTALLGVAGYELGANWPLVLAFLQAYGRVLGVLLVVGAAAWWAWRRRSRNHEAPQSG